MSILLLIWSKVKNIPTQPCCGYFLHGGTRVVGLLDFGLVLFSIIFIASQIYQSFHQLQVLHKNKEIVKYYVRIGSWALYFTYKILLLALSILLFKAVKRRSSRLCKIWIVISTLINLALIITFCVNDYLFSITRTGHAFLIFYFFYKLYCLHVVWSFVKELESYGGFNAAMTGLTDAEVEEFEKGGAPDTNTTSSHEGTVKNLGFNKDFEISADNLEIDHSSILGSGAFGCVYRGKLRTESGIKSVAVKTVNPDADVTYFKTLLSELKVMTFVSHHDNVVNLVGACTANIREKKLYVVVEFCPYGNLYEYLKARRGLFFNLVKDGEIREDVGSMGSGYANLNPANIVTTLDIFKWVHDASKGLEFLEQKKVIHGDIAIRNILLTYGKIAKISDFGLAKKLYQYTSVVKEEVLLPWRWLAIESLEENQYSLKSDVWSFGIAMWEAFSLSELPFPGFNWNKNFVNQINNGLRMSKPKNSTNDAYALMVKCWQPEPDDRPTFAEVRQTLEDLLNRALILTARETDKTGTALNTMNEPIVEDEIEMYIPNQAITDAVQWNG